MTVLYIVYLSIKISSQSTPNLTRYPPHWITIHPAHISKNKTHTSHTVHTAHTPHTAYITHIAHRVQTTHPVYTTHTIHTLYTNYTLLPL